MSGLIGKLRSSFGESPGRGASSTPEHRTLLTVVLLLIGFGTVMIYSATSARSLMAGGGLGGTTMLLRTVGIGVIPGLAVMFFAQGMNLDRLREVTPLLMVVSLAMLVLVLVPGLGHEANGARRWLGVGFMTFQPSEVAKVALMLFAASQALRHRGQLGTVNGILKAGFLPLCLGALLIVAEPDMGTAIVCVVSVLTVLVLAGMPYRMLGLIVIGFAGLVLLASVIEPYRMARLTAFLHPWGQRTGAGFQSVQGQIAIGSGGLFGVGLGQSVQKIFYLPEAHTDFILAVIGEEVGVVGLGALFSLYGILLFTGVKIALGAKDEYAKLVAAGATMLITVQALLNIWVVLGIAPLTGVPLPMISYGPTSLIVTLAALGLLLNIANGGRLKLRAVDGGNRGLEAFDGTDSGTDRDRRDRRSRRSGAQRR